jgi:hypothetical protein
MSDAKPPIRCSAAREGGCRCGRVRFRITAPPLLTMACHCTGCRKMTGSAFSLSAAIPSAGFAVTAGEPVPGGLKGNPRHVFCPDCMSWLFTRVDGMDEFVNIRTTMLDDPGGLEPFIETWTSEKLPWVTTPAQHTFPGFPEPAAYPALTRAYAGRDS